MDIQAMVQTAIPLLTALALKVVGAIILWMIGRKLINLARRLVVRSLKYPFDQTVANYIGTAVAVVLSSAAFGALHGRWLAGMLAGALYALAYYRRGRLGDAVLAHATTNALIAAYVLATGTWSLWS